METCEIFIDMKSKMLIKKFSSSDYKKLNINTRVIDTTSTFCIP